ncbi:aspartate-semialdehyde dehydrogenase [Alicyclobacillus ferrooxydans]|uniref:Aspartate-semialdehyde dehydrogenase n=1 Tax=Alicyclobacillus ferrooxydans TaxID=471514 RepID=A0A0P9EC40_9BACL|nr:aspartate-semialdehyde dehydrogenase [Alicyclobacillus ferrooxydans]KPV39840.1 aspartate-semialdehyde dehydrogenase [Alicyclobacillus ferrooxydans]
MSYQDGVTVAVLGATGAVGRAMLETLEKRNFPIRELRALASPRSAGQKLTYKGQVVTVEAVSEEAFEGVDIALFSAGASTSLEWAPKAVARGAVVVDNSSAYRMTDGVPLVVPEVNPEAVKAHQGIIANPNCSTIQLMVALSPLKQIGLEHVSVSTYQAVSGMGQKAVDALKTELERQDGQSTLFPVVANDTHYPMAFNVLPQCDVFVEDGYTKEEMKLVNESRKILELPQLKVSPTAVRVPVLYGHAESVSVRLKESVSVEQVRELMKDAPGLVVVDDPAKGLYPHPQMATGTGDTYVGRIRKDLWDDRTIWMFVVADNLLKGAAWNAVQIAELLTAY